MKEEKKHRMYIVKENHSLRSGAEVYKWTWWFKNKEDVQTDKMKVIQNDADLRLEVRKFKEDFPEGLILTRDFSHEIQ